MPDLKIMALSALCAMDRLEEWPFPFSHTKRAAGIPQFRNGNQRQRRRDHRRTRPHGWKGGAK
jgi:hypothetical protein